MTDIRYPLDLYQASVNTPYVRFSIIEFRERNFVVDNNRRLTNISPNKKILHNVVLPLPDQVSNSYSMQWEMADTQGIKFFEDLLQNDTAFGAITNQSTSANLQALIFPTISKIFAQKTPNPKKQALFNGIDPRSFSFNYTFAPTSLKEAEQLERMIKLLTVAALPSSQRVVTSESNVGPNGPLPEGQEIDIATGFEQTEDDALAAFFGFPEEFEIEFKGVAGFPKLSPCVCTSIQTNYTPQAMALLASNHAVQIQLSMSFMETELLRKTKPGL